MKFSSKHPLGSQRFDNYTFVMGVTSDLLQAQKEFLPVLSCFLTFLAGLVITSAFLQ